MKYETDLYRMTRPAGPDLQEAALSTGQLRKEMREASDGLMFYALKRDSVAAVATHCAATMLQMARTLDARQEQPDLADLVNGCCALILEARDMVDRALVIEDGQMLRGAAVVLEVTIRGILALLVGSVPYTALMETVAGHHDLHALLVACGAMPVNQQPPPERTQ